MPRAAATAAKGGDALWNTLGEVLLMRGKRAPAESAFVRAGAEHAPDSLAAALNLADPALRSRRARSRDEGVRPLHRRLQRRRAAPISPAKSSSPSRRPSNTSAPTIRSCSRTRSRRIDRAIADDPTNADAQGQARRAVSRQVQLCRRADDVRRRAASESERIRARCSAPRGGCRQTDSRRRLAASRAR